MNGSAVQFILIGIITGIFAGFFGVGGGIILIPMLVWFFQFNQHQAQGLSLAAMLLPVGFLATWKYYEKNPFPIKTALFISLGIFLGGYFGGLYAQKLGDRSLKMAFGVLTLIAGLKLILGK